MIIQQQTVGHFLDMRLVAEHFQMVNIKIYNIVGEIKLSLWEELHTGENNIVVDVSTLLKGSYRVTISYLNQKLKEDRFTLY